MTLRGLQKLICLVLVLGYHLGCRPPKPPVEVPPSPRPIPYCTGAETVTKFDICQSMFTQDGYYYACAACRGKRGAAPGAARACVEPNSEVYCAAGSCFDDPLCGYSDLAGSTPKP